MVGSTSQVAGAIYGNWYYSAESVLYRTMALACVFVVAAFIASRTEKGASVLELATGARTEWRKGCMANQAGA